MKKQKQLEKVTATYIEPQNLRSTCVAVAARQQRKRRTKTKWVQLDLFADIDNIQKNGK